MACQQDSKLDKYLLVCEGPTDTYVIKQLASKIYQNLGKSVEIIAMAPQIDATTGTWERHGWGGVRNWCKKFGVKTLEDIAAVHPSLRPLLARQNWQALMAIRGAKGLIIQIDSDIAEHIKDIPAFNPAVKHRRDYCEDALHHWLNEKPSKNTVHFAITSFAIETWLLATLDPNNIAFANLTAPYNLEDLSDWEARLIAAGFKAYRKDGAKRLLKSPSERYVPYGEQIANHAVTVRQKCASAESLCSFFEL